MIFYVYRFLASLTLTISIETVVLFVMMRRVFKKHPRDVSAGTLVATGFLASGATIPYVWFVFPYLLTGHLSLAIAIGELFALLAETGIYHLVLKLDARRAFLVSLIANASSFGIGYLLHFLANR